jgi:hypothetical protein
LILIELQPETKHRSSLYTPFRAEEPCFLRLGKRSKVHDDLKEHSEDYLIDTKGIKTTAELTQLYKSQPVIATTCLGANNHPCLQERLFDYCILDEAGKSTKSERSVVGLMENSFCGPNFTIHRTPSELLLPSAKKSAQKG